VNDPGRKGRGVNAEDHQGAGVDQAMAATAQRGRVGPGVGAAFFPRE
jgi:hypothetical protein